MVSPFVARTVVRRAPVRRPSFGCESLEPRRLLAAGGLDPSFGGDGDVSTSLPGVRLTGRDVAIQADGKTVVAGYTGAGSGDRFALTRYNLNGTPDTTFGPDHNGTVISTYGGSGRAVAIQPDGKIVVIGNSGSDTRVLRYNPDGGPDRTFGGGNGAVTFDPVGLFETAHFDQVIVQPDNKILLGGTKTGGLLDADFDLAFVRLNPDGSFDGSFDEDGKKTLDFGGYEHFGAMALDFSGSPATNPDYGKIVVVGQRDTAGGLSSTALVTRLTTAGALDTAFAGGAGRVFPARVDAGFTTATGVVIQDSGRIVVGGHVGPGTGIPRRGFMLVGLHRNGTFDTGFGPNGTSWVITLMEGESTSMDLIALPSGGLAQAGKLESLGDTVEQDVIAYFTPNGARDTRFGGDGTMAYDFTGDVALAAGPGRRFVFAGGDGMHAARFFDVGANLVYAATINSAASETGPTARGFIVYRLERLPVATRVYFTVGGTATAPNNPRGGSDYFSEGLVFPISFPGFPGGPPYVDIPANATFAVATITPVDDAVAEGNQTAVFTIRPDAAYEVGNPGSVTLIIADNDAPPPVVAQVWVRGSSWRGTDGDALNVTFKEYLAANGLGHDEFGYRVDNLPAGTTLPWANVNELVLRYSSPPTGSGIPLHGDVTLDGVRSDYAAAWVLGIDPQTFVVGLDRALGSPGGVGGVDGDRVALRVAGGGPNGAAYALTLNTLQGDADRAGGRVSALDVATARARSNRTSTEPPPTDAAAYTPFADVNTDGRVNALDVAAVRARLNLALPAALALVATMDRREQRDAGSATSVIG